MASYGARIGLAHYTFDIAPSDTVDLSADAQGIYVGVGGDIAIVNRDDSVVIFQNVPTGSILEVCTKRVNATGTNAGGLVGLKIAPGGR